MTRNESSVIAFQIPESAFSSYQIIASHSDCPTFKVKGEDPFVTDGHYTRLNVEGYGGMIRSPWFDRPLSLAGRMVVRDGNSVKSVLVDANEELGRHTEGFDKEAEKELMRRMWAAMP